MFSFGAQLLSKMVESCGVGSLCEAIRAKCSSEMSSFVSDQKMNPDVIFLKGKFYS